MGDMLEALLKALGPEWRVADVPDFPGQTDRWRLDRRSRDYGWITYCCAPSRELLPRRFVVRSGWRKNNSYEALFGVPEALYADSEEELRLRLEVCGAGRG